MFPSKYMAALTVMVALAACGGGGSGGAPSSAGAPASAVAGTGGSSPAIPPGNTAPTNTSASTDASAVSTTAELAWASVSRASAGEAVLAPTTCRFSPPVEPVIASGGLHPDEAAASRFLHQATFGATPASIAALASGSYESWLRAQFTLPRRTHLSCIDAELATGQPVDQSHFLQSWWGQALTGQDQLRQRVAFALSQILVVSFDGNLSEDVRGIASYYDLLERNAFGNYRTLLQEVTLHSMTAIYLTYLRNQKEDGKGRTPDENYARELMQLFTIGLHQLNDDGSLQLVGGQPVETYTNADVSALAKVFTGYGWGGPDNSDARFFNNTTPYTGQNRVIPLQAYPKFHSTSGKTFLGVTVPPQGSASVSSMAGELNLALDTLFNHPNVGPFIGRQLIQRLVTSNPSPAYVRRVATAFNDGSAHGFGSGQRGDMKAVIAAVLLDPEARPARPGEGAGKLREPVVRLANWARALGVVSASGTYRIGNTDNTTTGLGQTPMRASAVFNFYRPGYVPPNTRLAAQGLVAPEMQITHETSVAGYLNLMEGAIQNGVGTTVGGVRDLRTAYSAEMALAGDSARLIDRLDLLLMAGGMKTSTRNAIKGALDSIAIPGTSAAAADTARRQRVQLAVYLTMAAPEYLVQK